MHSTLFTALSIAVIALVTALIRATPFFAFGGKRNIPEMVHYLGKALTPAIIIILVIFCIKDTNFYMHPYGLPELISIVWIVCLQKWRKNTILSILSGTICYMLLIRLF